MNSHVKSKFKKFFELLQTQKVLNKSWWIVNSKNISKFLKHVTHHSFKLSYKISILNWLLLNQCIFSYVIFMALFISKCVIQSESTIFLRNKKGRNCYWISDSSSDSWMVNDWRTGATFAVILATDCTADILFRFLFDETSLIVFFCGKFLSNAEKNMIKIIENDFEIQ